LLGYGYGWVRRELSASDGENWRVRRDISMALDWRDEGRIWPSLFWASGHDRVGVLVLLLWAGVLLDDLFLFYIYGMPLSAEVMVCVPWNGGFYLGTRSHVLSSNPFFSVQNKYLGGASGTVDDTNETLI